MTPKSSDYGRVFFQAEVFRAGRLAERRPRPSDTIIERARQVPVFRDCDVLIAGGGPAGTAAAIAAAIARRLRQRRPRPSDRRHLDEMVVRIAGKRMYLWRAVDNEGEVLDMLVQRRRDSWSALRLMRKLLKKQCFVPKIVVTDKLRSYACAFQRLRLTCRHEQGLRKNNRAENSHQAV